MARFFYTLKRETDTLFDDSGYDNIDMARTMAMRYIKQGKAKAVIIERNFKNYMIIWSNGIAAYMKGNYAEDNGTLYLLNPDGSIRMSSKTARKKTARRK